MIYIGVSENLAFEEGGQSERGIPPEVPSKLCAQADAQLFCLGAYSKTICTRTFYSAEYTYYCSHSALTVPNLC